MVLVRPEEHQISQGDVQEAAVKVKTPKRVLQFSDGVLEEYSTDEEDNVAKEEPVVDLSNLTWGLWLSYKAWNIGNSTLSVIDSVGGFFASIFGITTPRYYFELEEHNRREEERLKEEDEERGWSQPSAASAHVPLNQEVGSQPKPVIV